MLNAEQVNSMLQKRIKGLLMYMWVECSIHKCKRRACYCVTWEVVRSCEGVSNIRSIEFNRIAISSPAVFGYWSRPHHGGVRLIMSCLIKTISAKFGY